MSDVKEEKVGVSLIEKSIAHLRSQDGWIEEKGFDKIRSLVYECDTRIIGMSSFYAECHLSELFHDCETVDDAVTRLHTQTKKYQQKFHLAVTGKSKRN